MATKNSGIAPVGNNNYQTSVTKNTDGSLSATTYRVDAKGGNAVPVSTVNTDVNGKSTRSYESGATAAEKEAFSNPNSPERKAYTQQVTDPKLQRDLDLASDQEKKNAANLSQSSAASNAGSAPGTSPQSGEQQPTDPAQTAAASEEAGSFKTGTRSGDNAYSLNMKYPLDLAVEVQDVIKFSILEYSPSLAKDNQAAQGSGQFGTTKNRVVSLEGSSPIIKGSKRIGVITLPIPANISDGNTANWQNGEMNAVETELANIAQGFFNSGMSGAKSAVENTASNVEAGAKSGDVQAAIKSVFLASAVSQSAAQRAFGAVVNNNLELLFFGPNLRSFGFTFLFYPRDPNEAKMVRQIIRAFKQSMSVKRSKTSLLLKAPHTFAISYMTAGGKMHPYLNSFKECALTSCSVDYTPDGTYMTYGGEEKSMTAYRLTLTFQELEPIFDDEYDQIDKNKDTHIGF